jgi:hypothetical protein
MKKYILILFAFIGSFANAQGYDFQQLCLDCAAQNGFYCGDDPANWTQYSPMGCVPNGEGGLFYLNDGWEDCADGSDEAEAVPTTPQDCAPPPQECDTVFIEIPFIEWIYDTIVQIEYETIVEYDTIVEVEYIYETIVEIEYEYITEYITEYLDCDTGLPCGVGMEEVIDKSISTGLIYNLKGEAIKNREGIFIENGKVKYLLK